MLRATSRTLQILCRGIKHTKKHGFAIREAVFFLSLNLRPFCGSGFDDIGMHRRQFFGRRSRIDDAVHDELRESPPWQRTEILLVVQFDHLAALQHQFAGEFGIIDRELELVRLNRAGSLGAYARLYQLALVSLEYHALVNDVIQFSALDAFAEDEVESEIYEHRNSHDEQRGDQSSEFFQIIIFLNSPANLLNNSE